MLSMLAALFSTHVAVYVYLLLATAHFFPGTIDERLGARRGERLPI